jgi:hypothetical protein
VTTVLFDTMAQLEATFDRFVRFNPNHVGSGPHGGEFAPGHGKHHAKRQRRKAKLQAMRKAGHKEIADQRKRHRGERKSMVISERHDRKRIAKEHKSEAKDKLKDYQRDAAAIRKEYSSTPRKIKREGKEKLVAAKEYHKKLYTGMKESHKQEWKDLTVEHGAARKEVVSDQKKERRQLGDDLKKELREKFKKKGNARAFEWPARIGDAADQRSLVRFLDRRHREDLQSLERRADDALLARSAMAFGAEDIVRHILSQRGYTKRWRDGDLSGKQHLSLLEDCRQFGRARLRHEAETLFEIHGVEDEFERGRLGEEVLSRVIGRSESGADGFRDGTTESACEGSDKSDQKASEIEVIGGRPDSAKAGQIHIISRSVASRATGAVTRFFRRAKQFLHELITAGAMLLKGDEPLTAEEILAVDRQARKQAEYLEGFEREVRANPPREISDLSTQVIDATMEPMSSFQFIARAESYGDAVWASGQDSNRSGAKTQGYNEERRVLGDAIHCFDCPPLANMEWQPIGTLPMIGDTECGGHCHCHFEYRVDASQKATPVPRKPRKPRKPKNTRPKGVGSPEAKTAEPSKPEPVPEKKVEPIPQEQPPRKIPLKPAPKIGEPYPKGGTYPPARPVPTIKEVIEGAASPHPVEYYEEI